MSGAVLGASLNPAVMVSEGAKGRLLSSATSTEGVKGIDFKAIFSGEILSAENLAQLEQFLPPAQIVQLQSLMANGNELPGSADFAEDNLLGNPALLQLMAQLQGEVVAGDSLPISDSTSRTVGAQYTLADLQALLLKQGNGKGNGALVNQNGKDDGVPVESGGRVFNTAYPLLAKPEIPLPLIPAQLQVLKAAPLSSDISALFAQGSTSPTQTPFSSLMSGLDQLSALRTETLSPTPINVPAGDKGWDNVLSNRIMWMVGKQMQTASLQITPRHLGPIDIQVSVQNDQTSVSFIAQNAAVKEALEAAIPRMRELFSESNMQLVNVDVGQRESGSGRSAAEHFDQAGSANGNHPGVDPRDGTIEDEENGSEPLMLASSLGLVDDYA